MDVEIIVMTIGGASIKEVYSDRLSSVSDDYLEGYIDCLKSHYPGHKYQIIKNVIK